MKRTSRPENLCRRKHRRKISSGSRGRACASSSVFPFLFAPLMRLIRNFISRKKPCLWGSASYNIKLPCTVIFPLFATLLYVCTCIEVRVLRMAARMVGSYVLLPPVQIYFRRKFRATENSIRASRRGHFESLRMFQAAGWSFEPYCKSFLFRIHKL